MADTKRFISVDIEMSGPTPGKYSMLSLGACVVGDTDKVFYAELKPISDGYVTAAMRVACLGLRCLASRPEREYNPQHSRFDPSKALGLLREKGQEPSVAMRDFVRWSVESTLGCQPVLAAYPTPFDVGTILWYLDNFIEEPRFVTKKDDFVKHPFGQIARDIGDLCRGHYGNDDAKLEWLGVHERRRVVHNALEDAIQQARVMEELLRRMKRRNRKESSSDKQLREPAL